MKKATDDATNQPRKYSVHNMNDAKLINAAVNPSKLHPNRKGSIRAFIKEINVIARNESRHQNNPPPTYPSQSPSKYMYLHSLRSFRVMGRVVHMTKPTKPTTTTSSPSSSSDNDRLMSFHYGEHDNDFTTLRLDDGTDWIDALVDGTIMNRVDGKVVQMGDCIDCVGRLILCQKRKSNCESFKDVDIQKYNNAKEHYFFLLVQFFSIVKDPNLETLRMVELSSRQKRTLCTAFAYTLQPQLLLESMHSNDKDRDSIIMSHEKDIHVVTVNEDDGCRSNKENGIYMYGDSVAKLAPFQRKIIRAPALPPPTQLLDNDTATTPIQKTKLTVNTKYVLNLIQCSSPAGINQGDLKLLLDCETGEQIQALNEGLEQLRNSYEIYITNTGAYLPM